MVLETEKTPDKPLHRIAERYRPTLTFNHQRSHVLPPGTYAHAVFAPQLASAYNDFAASLLRPTYWRQEMFSAWLSDSRVVARAEEVGAIRLLKTHFVQLPPGSWSKVRALTLWPFHDANITYGSGAELRVPQAKRSTSCCCNHISRARQRLRGNLAAHPVASARAGAAAAAAACCHRPPLHASQFLRVSGDAPPIAAR